MFDFDYDRAAIITELGIQSSDEEFQVHVLKRIDELLDANVGMIIQDALSEEDLVQLDKLGNDKEAVKAFLAERFPNYKEIYERELRQIVDQLKVALGGNK